MWLILPDEGKTVQDVLCEGEIFEMPAAGDQPLFIGVVNQIG